MTVCHAAEFIAIRLPLGPVKTTTLIICSRLARFRAYGALPNLAAFIFTSGILIEYEPLHTFYYIFGIVPSRVERPSMDQKWRHLLVKVPCFASGGCLRSRFLRGVRDDDDPAAARRQGDADRVDVEGSQGADALAHSWAGSSRGEAQKAARQKLKASCGRY